jgi:hypothetical protein
MMFVGPVTHVTCDLDTQRRIQDARRDAAIGAALGSSRRRLLDRLLGRPSRPSSVDAVALLPRGEDLAHALRY